MSDDYAEEQEELAPQGGKGVVQRLLNFVPVIGVAVCCFFLAASWDDVKYLLQPSTPVDLGGPGAYHMEAAGHGVYAKIRGEVHSEGARFQREASNGKVWPLVGAPVVLERASFDELRGEVSAEGELEIDDKLPKQYAPVIATFLKRHQLGVPGPEAGTAHTFVLVMGHAPRGVDKTNAWLVILLALFALNAWWVIRPLILRR